MSAATCLLSAAPAAAQLGTVLPPGGFSFNAADCGSNTTQDIQFDVEPLSGQFFWSLQLTQPQVATGSSCPRFGDAAPVQVVLPFGEAEVAALGRFQLLVNLTPAEILGTACTTERLKGNLPLCIYFSRTTANPAGAIDIFDTSVALTIDVDTLVPPAPTFSVSEGDASLQLTVVQPDTSLGDTYTYVVQFRTCADLSADTDGGTIVAPVANVDGGAVTSVTATDSLCDAPGPYAVQTFSDNDISLRGLVVDEEYEVRVIVIDNSGNESPVSEAQLATPRGELGPLDLYDGEGNFLSVAGPDVESCNKSAASSMGPLGLGFFGWRARRRRRGADVGHAKGKVKAMSPARRQRLGSWFLFSLFILPLLVVSTALPAAAYPGQITVGFKGGPYTPAIDSELSGGSRIYPIYECFFSKAGIFPNGILPMPAIDVDVHLFDKFGSLELGLGLAFSQARGTSVPVAAVGPTEISTRTCPSATGTESVELSIMMVKPQLTYRLDPLNDYFGIPFVPYGRVALVGAAYAFTENSAFDNDGVASGRNPLGVRFGAELSVGMMFALDWLDLRNLWDSVNYAIRTRDLDFQKLLKKSKSSTTLLEHTYFFAELSTSQINSFGSPGLILSPTDKVFGTELPWTFQFGMAAEVF